MKRKRPLRILILEDSQDEVHLLVRELRKSNLDFKYEVADTRAEFESGINLFEPEIILSDHSLPQFNSLEALKICRKAENYIPFILVTGNVSEEFAASCIHEGADDYILKSNLNHLPRAIKEALHRQELENKRRKVIEDLKSQNLELTKVNHDLDSFVCSTSHNLRTPLRSVLGLLHLFKIEMNKGNKESSESYFKMMETSIGQLDETLKNILDFSKNSRLEEEADEIDFDYTLNKLFESVRFMNVETVIQKTIKIQATSKFKCSEMRLDIVLANLLSNAVKYSDPSKPECFINMMVYTDRDKARILIQDNGIGIAEEHHESVFKMFYRATDRSEGTGLGLYIVKEAVRKLGGSISLSSELGKGTTITLIVPNMI